MHLIMNHNPHFQHKIYMYHNENKTHRMSHSKKTVEKVKNTFFHRTDLNRKVSMKPVQDYIYTLSEKYGKTEKCYDFVTFRNFFGLILPKKLRNVVDFLLHIFTKNLTIPYIDRDYKKITES